MGAARARAWRVYDFGWLDRVVELLWSNGIAVDLATPTAAPPAWLVRRHPEMLPVTADGVRLEFGSRRHYCPSSPVFREASVRIAEQLARRYGEHPALAMWHVGNEYGCHVPACYCEVSAEHFRRWLDERYGEIEELNRAWGTAFWGQRYGDWAEIEPPRRTPTSVNPTQALDWARFCSDALLECFEAEREVLAAVTPDIPVTTNFMSPFQPADYWAWAAREDVVTLDSYPDPADPDAHVAAALNYDLMRSLGGGRPVAAARARGERGQLARGERAEAAGADAAVGLQAVAHGSDGAMFFQWRAARAGAEKFHSAMLPHGGTRGARLGGDVRLGASCVRSPRSPVRRTPPRSRSFSTGRTGGRFDGADHPSQRLDLPTLVRSTGTGRSSRRTSRSTSPTRTADLDGYRLVVAPNLYLATDDALDGAGTRSSSGGGVLVCGFFSGVVDEHDHVRSPARTLRFAELLGARVDEFWPLPAGQRDRGRARLGRAASGARLVGVARARRARRRSRVRRRACSTGRPAVVRNRVGEGTVLYASARLGRLTYERLVTHLAAEASVVPTLSAPAGVEVTRRDGHDAAYLFLLNHSDGQVEIRLPEGEAADLLGQDTLDGATQLGPLGVAVVRIPHPLPEDD